MILGIVAEIRYLIVQFFETVIALTLILGMYKFFS